MYSGIAEDAARPLLERVAFLASVGSSPDVIKQVLVLTEAFAAATPVNSAPPQLWPNTNEKSATASASTSHVAKVTCRRVAVRAR